MNDKIIYIREELKKDDLQVSDAHIESVLDHPGDDELSDIILEISREWDER